MREQPFRIGAGARLQKAPIGKRRRRYAVFFVGLKK